MSSETNRRDFLVGGALATSGVLAANGAQAAAADEVDDAPKAAPPQGSTGADEFPRFHAGAGGPVGSASDRGKLTPGIRASGLPPVLLDTPDLEKLPFKMVDGVKEFHLRPMPVYREILPGQFAHFYGYNGSMPGPTIEAIQGDRIRVVVHNELPEATTVHWHGLECPNTMDGIPFVTQNMIPPGGTFVYEFTLHQVGSLIYHVHVAMQEAIGMCGMFVIHPKVAYDPPVDQDFGLVLQQFSIAPASDVVNTISMDWNYLTLNGKCGPLATPLVVKQGNRVRIRYFNFSTLHQHPMHLHGHTFWITGTEGGRIPEPAWTPGNTVVLGIAEIREVEFIANNPGDWVMHCHMFHHMMNHMVSQVGPHIRGKKNDPGFDVPGYPQNMEGAMTMSPENMRKVAGKQQTQGMRSKWFMGVAGMFTVVRVLPGDLYDEVMAGKRPIPAGSSVFGETPKTSEPAEPGKA